MWKGLTRSGGALRWWEHRWDGCGVPVAFVGGEGV